MSPLELRILLHYYAFADDFPGDLSVPAVRAAIDRFTKADDLLKMDQCASATATYMITARGRAFVEHLCSQPLPVQNFRSSEVGDAMKAMKQMQDEMLSKARWDGGYPKCPSRQLIAFALWLAMPTVGQFSPLAAVAVGLVGFGFYIAAVARE